MKRHIPLMALTVAVSLAVGCEMVQPPAVPEAPRVITPVETAPPEPPAPSHEASLWRDNAPLADLYATTRAQRVGDILIVKVVESSTATNQAATKTERESDITAGLQNFFNLEKWYPANYVSSRWPYLNPFGSVAAKMENQFDASGTTKRSGNLAATITVRVIEVLPGGQLKIAGSREVMVNNERQYITLSGMVRSQDVAWDNSILSTSIADARISYSGVGVVNDRQRPGWAMRLFDLLWPF